LHFKRLTQLGFFGGLAILIAGVASAEKDRTVTIQRGDSIDSLARRFHVSKASIEKANHLTPDSVLRNGKVLVIPPSPKVFLKSVSTRLPGKIHGDRIAMRIGPGETYQRSRMLDNGAEILVTNRSNKWLQVKLESGKMGWIREDFVAYAKHSVSNSRIARNSTFDTETQVSTPKTKKNKKKVSKKHKVVVARHSKKSRRRIRYASSKYTHRRRSNRPEADAPEPSNDVLRAAYAYRGTPYHFGGTSKGGFDCSGFTSYVYKKQGVSLPRTAAEQFHKGKKVSSDSMKPGDLVFFHTTRKGVSHVGVYAGDGKFVHSSSAGGTVRVDTLNSGYYKQRLVGARRVKDEE